MSHVRKQEFRANCKFKLLRDAAMQKYKLYSKPMWEYLNYEYRY